VVCDAVQILGRREAASAVPVIEALTRHADDNVALAAVEALGRIGGKAAIDSLLAMVRGRNFFRTFPTIDVLGRSGDPRVLGTLLELSQESLYASEAVRALGRLGDPAAASPLILLLERAPENLVRTIAVALVAIHEHAKRRFATGVAVERVLLNATSLPELRAKLVDSIRRADPVEQAAVAEILAWIGEESTVPALVSLLEAAGTVAQVAATSLRKLVGVAEPQLLDALRTGLTPRKRLLIPLLGGRPGARDALVACLSDEDPGVRALACDALARGGDVSVCGALFTLLGDPDGRVAQAALGAIQSLGSVETKELALAAAENPDVRVRCAALRIIGYFAYPEGFEFLARGASDGDERVRDAAIAGLPLFEEPRSIELLIQAAHHETTRTRTAAIRALGHTTPRGTGAALVLGELRSALRDSNPWVRYYACQSLGRLRDDGATEALAALLTDESGQVRVAAVDALAHLHGPRAFEVLATAVDSEDPDMHRAALVALGISKRPEGLPMLLAAVRTGQTPTRLVALSALAELGVPEAVAAVARATEDRDEGVRSAAAGFLAARSDDVATRELIELVIKHPTRESLVHALARPAEGRVAAIVSALGHADDAVASALVGCLARMGSVEAVTAIRATLEAPNDAARRASALALVLLHDAESAPLLERAALNDADPEVRRICTAALGR
ncbi:MAG TPA: HEAT repeat domain-containing protein, partial [Polyangiaceae bacterium]|nr:HEAT repeat domain-containing protein [Polyangiaceae bacterium]